jgi:hypothetical protein
MAQFTNQAQLSYNNATVNSNVAVGEVLEVLSAAKTAVTGVWSVTPGTTVLTVTGTI